MDSRVRDSFAIGSSWRRLKQTRSAEETSGKTTGVVPGRTSSNLRQSVRVIVKDYT